MVEPNSILLKIVLPEKHAYKVMKFSQTQTIADIKRIFASSHREKIEESLDQYEIVLHFPPDILVTDETRTIQSYNLKPLMECTMKRKKSAIVSGVQSNLRKSSNGGIATKSTLEEKKKTAQHISELMVKNPELFVEKLGQLDKTKLASLVMVLGYAIATEICDSAEIKHERKL